MDISKEIQKYMYLSIKELNIQNKILRIVVSNDIKIINIPDKIEINIPDINKLILIIHPDKIKNTFPNLNKTEFDIFEDCIKEILTNKFDINLALELLSKKIDKEYYKIITNKLNYNPNYNPLNYSFKTNDLDTYYYLRKAHENFFSSMFDCINGFITNIYYNFRFINLPIIKEIVEKILEENDNQTLVEICNKLINIPILYDNIKDKNIADIYLNYDIKVKITNEIIRYYEIN